MSAADRVSTPFIFKAAKGLVSASLAHTLSECVFWMQAASKEIDGRPAIYKTGAQLADALGGCARTANHSLNYHRPSSMAFAHSLETFVEKIEEHKKPPTLQKTCSNLDSGFFT